MASCAKTCPPKITAGELRHQIVIQRPTLALTPTGGTTTTWDTYKTVWAAVKALSGDEVLKRAKLNEQTTHEFRMRWPDVSDILVTDRVLFLGRHYDILFIDNLDYDDTVGKFRTKYGDPA